MGLTFVPPSEPEPCRFQHYCLWKSYGQCGNPVFPVYASSRMSSGCLLKNRDQNGSLVVGLLTVLFPVFKGRRLGVNGLDKHLLGHLQLFLQCDDFRTSRGFDWLVFDLLVTQRTLAFTCWGQVVEPFEQLGKNIAFGQGVCLAFTSFSRSAFTVCLSLLRSSSSSLPYRLKTHSCGLRCCRSDALLRGIAAKGRFCARADQAISFCDA